MATITWTCSRCTKETQDPFVWEYMTKSEGLTRICLCSRCKDWALTILLQEYPNEIVDIAKMAEQIKQGIILRKSTSDV